MGKQVADAHTLENLILRLAKQVDEEEWEDFIFVGILRGGDSLARRIGAHLQTVSEPPPVYFIDITLYRDDLYSGLEFPTLGGSHLPMNIDGKRIILVDDVLFTGRTIRAALQELMDYGRPEWIKLLVLVDRGYRELPIQPDVVGMTITCPKTAKVKIMISDVPSSSDEIVLSERGRDE